MIDAACLSAEERIGRLLTEEQKQNFEKMRGEAYDVSALVAPGSGTVGAFEREKAPGSEKSDTPTKTDATVGAEQK